MCGPARPNPTCRALKGEQKGQFTQREHEVYRHRGICFGLRSLTSKQTCPRLRDQGWSRSAAANPWVRKSQSVCLCLIRARLPVGRQRTQHPRCFLPNPFPSRRIPNESDLGPVVHGQLHIHLPGRKQRHHPADSRLLAPLPSSNVVPSPLGWLVTLGRTKQPTGEVG